MSQKEDLLGQVVWLNRGWQAAYIGFCPSRRAWNREMRRLGVKDEPYPANDAQCSTFDKKGALTIIVTLRDGAEQDCDRVEIAGALCHEAAHVWQFVRNHMGEKDPSPEFEAYSMQAIFQNLYQAWLDTRAPPTMLAAAARRERRA